MENNLRRIDPNKILTSINTQPENTPPSSTEAVKIERIQQDEPVACQRCQDAGYYCLDVLVGDPNFGQLITCDCRLAEKMQRRQQQRYEISNLHALHNKTFAAFNAHIPGVQEAYNAAVAYSQSPHGWLFLFGKYGCGKTHLAAAIANELSDQGRDVIWTVVPDLLDHLRSTFGPSSEVRYDDRFETVRNINILVVDDLGTESATPWAREKLFQLLNHRYNNNLATVITSNQDLDNLDPRIRSRVCDMALCQMYLIQAKDFRALSLKERQSSMTSYR